MANQKPKKSAKKPADKPESNKDAKDAKVVDEEVIETETISVSEDDSKKTITSKSCDKPMKGFFARKYSQNENILTIFKTPKIWGALIGEALGMMIITMFMLMVGIGSSTPLYCVLVLAGVYLIVVRLSGAHLNPLVTAGMMATRRVSAIRGILYMLAQLLGGWIGLLILNGFRIASETQSELPMMNAIENFEGFLPLALLELFGAVLIAFGFARALRFAKKNPTAFALSVTAVLAFVFLFGWLVAYGYFGVQNGCTFNPVVALMYRVIPTALDTESNAFAIAGFGILTYIIVPIIGGVIGFYLSDIATRLSCGGYFCDCDDDKELDA